MHTQSNLIGHRATGHKNGGFFGQQVCDTALQLIQGRIHIDDIVSDFGPKHRFSHA
jgi:hypothetical protein